MRGRSESCAFRFAGQGTMNDKLQSLPKIETDAEAEAFVEGVDLTAFDLSKMKPASNLISDRLRVDAPRVAPAPPARRRPVHR